MKEVRLLRTPFLLDPVESAEEVPWGLSLRRVGGEERLFGPPLPFCTLPRESEGKSSSVSSSVLHLDPELTWTGQGHELFKCTLGLTNLEDPA